MSYDSRKEKGSSVYFYPYSHNNDFININQKEIESLGFNITPIRQLFSFGAWRARKNSVLILNWVEDQMYRSGISLFHALTLFVWFFIIALLGKVMTNNIIWVRHNYVPHNAKGNLYLHALMCKILNMLSTRQICLETYYGQQTIPHPLYLSDEQIQFKLAEIEFDVHTRPRFAFVGAIKSYKGIHKALASWPKCQPMLIAGACDDIAYAQRLEAIIEERGLEVECRYGYLSDHALEGILKSYDFIVLAHEDNRMISSGTFYHAITFGCNLLCLPSKFTLTKAAEHDFVHVLTPSEFTPDNIERLPLISRKQVMQEALRHYSREKIRNVWRTILS
ncbi:hypothetical protein GMES_0895 [Paraglaciecola mesophila KMM 241]|uniref:Glycosyl transferase family 1 domain-containing protein n=1 Tax=Paraglaciecola mesophila KMM 241 TaxID=1128912 RepID=K6ZII3_9ALTE|nr:hypothetical protein [Paraglaciecola mesophila]GAC23195.1 hypothetical protein GMES_0895 [Paraglaciecola mesophila KMM 241]